MYDGSFASGTPTYATVPSVPSSLIVTTGAVAGSNLNAYLNVLHELCPLGQNVASLSVAVARPDSSLYVKPLFSIGSYSGFFATVVVVNALAVVSRDQQSAPVQNFNTLLST